MTLHQIRPSDGAQLTAAIPEGTKAVMGQCGMDLVAVRLVDGRELSIRDLAWTGPEQLAIAPAPSPGISEISVIPV